ncbi:MAG: hypothetical protein RIM84_05945 [Alphaproteobacteria bacterium]
MRARTYRRWLSLVLVALLPACEQMGLEDFNPLADLTLPDIELPQVELPSLGDPLPTYAAADLLPTMGYTVFDEQVANVEGDNGGYPGDIAPLPEPVTLVRQDVPRFDAYARVRGGNGDFQIHGFGGTAQVQVDTLWDVSVVTFQTAERRLSALTPPLARGRVLATPTGDVRGVALTFPAFEARGQTPPARDSADYQALAETLRYLAAPLSEAPVRVGDDLGVPVPLARLMRRTASQPTENTAATRVLGQTTYRGRPALVAQYDGAVAYEHGGDRLRFEIAGHLLVDIDTGLGVLSVLRLSRQGQLDGAPVEDQALIETAAWPRADPAT